MRLQVHTHKENADVRDVKNNNFLTERIGFWAVVKEVNSKTNSVTVVSDTGYEYTDIPVLSREWVTVDDTKNYISGQRNLPPVKSWVFVLTPTKTANGAFVLCSGYTKGDENIRELWAKNESELEDKNNCRELKTQGGWDIKEEYSNGNFTIESDDGNIHFSANTAANSQKEQKKEIAINAWKTSIAINENGITVEDVNGNKVETTANGLKITDKNNNITETKSTGIEITDVNGNAIKTTATNIQILGAETNKVKIGNKSGTIKTMLQTLLTKLNSGTVVTAGSQTAQSITAGQFQTDIETLANILE